MTGDLLDQHDMLEINVYSNIDHQPFEYAHENDIKQMPDMWTDMAFSGDVAREFEQWEQEIEDELAFNMKVSVRRYVPLGLDGLIQSPSSSTIVPLGLELVGFAFLTSLRPLAW